MTTIKEIEAAIEKLAAPEVEEIWRWLDGIRNRRPNPPAVENWLRQARGAAAPGVTTDAVLAATRGDE